MNSIEISSKEKRKIEWLIFFEKILSWLFPVLTVIAYTSTSLSGIYALWLGSLLAAWVFALIVTIEKWWRQHITKRVMYDMLIGILCIGILYHGLYFTALEYSSPNNVALINQLQIVCTFLIIWFLRKKEPVSATHFWWSLLMMIGAIFLLYDGWFIINRGDMYILLACVIAPIWNVYQKRALHSLSIPLVMFWRSLISWIVLCIWAYIFLWGISFSTIGDNMLYLLFTGIIYLVGTKIVWMLTIKKISVTHAISFTAVGPIIVFFFSRLLLGDTATLKQIISAIVITIGLFVMLQAKLKKTNYDR